MDINQKWKDLLQWLDSHATHTTTFKATINHSCHENRNLVATEDIPESTPIISLPPSALLNTKTLPKAFVESCSSHLTSTQALTLFLAIYRSNQQIKKCHTSVTIKPKDQDFYQGFIPYLSTLPNEFPKMPLVWILRSFFDGDDEGTSKFHQIYAVDRCKVDRLEHLLKHQNSSRNYSTLPYHQFFSTTTVKNSNQVLGRFLQDWSALLVDLRSLAPTLLLFDLVWAWLVVNTRCIWYNLGYPNHDDNITLAPGFDMANHSTASPITPIRTPHSLTMFSSYPTGAFNSPQTNQMLKSSKQKSDFVSTFNPNHLNPKHDGKTLIEKGQEITFAYGSHSNATLLVEYGFITTSISSFPNGGHDHAGDNPWDLIDISDQIENLFRRLDDSSVKIDILKSSGYWGDYVLQCGDSIEGSYRTLVALRLLHSQGEAGIQRWKEHTTGQSAETDAEIELKIWQSFHEILVHLVDLAEQLVDRVHHTHLILPSDSRLFLQILAQNELFYLSSFTHQSEEILDQFN